MRKIALLTVPLVVLGLVSLHAEPMVSDSPTVELSGSSTLTFGIDLATNATGFSNTMETDLKVTLIPKATSDTGMDGMGDIYGWVELKDYKWEVTSADGSGATTAPSITTKLFLGPFSITTYNKPTIEVDYVDPDNDGDDVSVIYGSGDGGGLTLGYELDPIDLSVGVISHNDWKDDDEAAQARADCHVHNPDGTVSDCPVTQSDSDQNRDNAYAFLGKVGVDVGDSANVEMAVAYGHEYDYRPIGIGAKATFDLNNDTIHPNVAFDGEIPDGGGSIPWDVGAGLRWDFSDDEDDDDKTYFKTDLMMFIPAEGTSELGISATLKEGDEDKGSLAGLGAEITIRLDDLTSQNNETSWGTDVSAHYKVSGIKPFFDVSFSNKEDAKTAFKAGLELSMVDHLVTTLQYASTDITGTKPDRGEVTASLKITY